MSDDDLAYLQPGYDLSSLTVPKIRSILVSHDIPYPASAKKPQLIQLMETELLPKAKKILGARSRTKASAKGIVDVPSSQESTQDDSDANAGELMPPPPVPRTPSRGRKKRTIDVADSIEVGEETPRTSRKTPGRRSTAKHSRASSTETEPRTDASDKPSARKSRKSRGEATTAINAGTSHVKIAEPDLAIKREFADNDSPFSNDNPFQSGSSPSSRDRRRSKDMKRRSAGASTDERRKSSSRRRQTTSPPTAQVKQEDDITVPSRSTFEFPVSRLHQPETKAPKVEIKEEFQPGEEFTPEAQLELVRERAAQGYSSADMVPFSHPKRRAQKPRSSIAKFLPWTTLLMILACFAVYWRYEKLEIGYCGIGKPQWSLTETAKLPSWANSIQPTCEPCPQHAYCYSNFEARCDRDFILKPHPLSLGGLVPLPPTCEPDSEKLRKMTSVANRAIEELRDRKAKYECNEPTKDGEVPATVEIAEEELKKEVSKKRRKGMTQEEFEDLWKGALGEILGREEVLSSSDGLFGSNELRLSSTSLALASYPCLLRRRIRSTFFQHRGLISALAFLVSTALYARSMLIRRRRAAARVPELVEVALDRLATQAALAAGSAEGGVGGEKEGWLSIGQLRDDVLRAELSNSERERVWRGVKDVVEGNANVRVGVREDARSGEVSRVWEWIGPVHTLPTRGDTSRRGEDGETREMAEKSKGMGTPIRESRKWDEGRPAY